jgi:histidinol-phosphate aminotransferase
MLRESVRLHMNEMPYPPSSSVVKAVQEGLAMLNRYVDTAEMETLQELLAGYCGVPKDHLILSPGSDLLLREMIQAFSKGRRVITPSPSFLPTVQAAKQFAAEWLSIRLSPPAFDLNLEVLTSVLEGPSLVIIDNPNNPTGRTLLDPLAVETLLQRPEVLLVIDEAYYEFSGVTFADRVADHPQLAIIRTMDKAFSLAGARVGYGIAGKAFGDVLSPFYAFLPRPSLCAAVEALRQPGDMRGNVGRVVEERERLRQALDDLGVRVYPSSTNFLLVWAKMPELVARLRGEGVLVSDVSNQLPAGFFRVSIGTPRENDAFVEALAQQIREHSSASDTHARQSPGLIH